jgi:hypothetical protein
LPKGNDKALRELAQKMRAWEHDPDFEGVRGAAALAKLPEAERERWQKLWQEVEELRKRSAEPK